MSIKAKPNEKELMSQVAQGDERAFAELFQGYYRPLADYVFRLTDDLGIAEEVVQDTFVKLWLRREALTTVERLADYLFVLSRNQALNHLRMKARERVKQLEWLQAIGSDLVDESIEDLSAPYRELLDRAVGLLPARQQQVFVMAKRQRMKHEEIARELGLSVETVRKHMKLALKSIREYAGKHGDNRIDPTVLILIFYSIWNFHTF